MHYEIVNCNTMVTQDCKDILLLCEYVYINLSSKSVTTTDLCAVDIVQVGESTK